jgi:hypothetical protein
MVVWTTRTIDGIALMLAVAFKLLLVREVERWLHHSGR